MKQHLALMESRVKMKLSCGFGSIETGQSNKEKQDCLKWERAAKNPFAHRGMDKEEISNPSPQEKRHGEQANKAFGCGLPEPFVRHDLFNLLIRLILRKYYLVCFFCSVFSFRHFMISKIIATGRLATAIATKT
jgi:hypothetical protein